MPLTTCADRDPTHIGHENDSWTCTGPTESSPLLEFSHKRERRVELRSELSKLGKDAILLVAANLLQFALNTSTILVISPLGKTELGAASVATTTANITGFIVFQGLSTSLDTLCAQAWGSGNPQLVKLHVQRMIVLLSLAGVVIAIFWCVVGHSFHVIIPDEQTASYAALYLKLLLLALPGYIIFEAGKRMLTARGIFLPVTVAMCVGVVMNVFFGWLFVWHTELGFTGAPLAIATTWTLLAVYLLMFLNGTGQGTLWSRATDKILDGWGPMLRLAMPGLIMVEAEYFAFEILVVISAQFSTAHLAAQTILATINSAFWQIPFSIGVAGTTRIAQHIGAGSVSSAQLSACIVLAYTACCSASSSMAFFFLRGYWPLIFTDDAEVVGLVERALPIVAVMHLFDGLAACCNAMLRGIGRPAFGGWTNLVCYYAIALPLSLWTGFGLEWGLAGLWIGVSIALVIVVVVELVYLATANWTKSVEDAVERNR